MSARYERPQGRRATFWPRFAFTVGIFGSFAGLAWIGKQLMPASLMALQLGGGITAGGAIVWFLMMALFGLGLWGLRDVLTGPLFDPGMDTDTRRLSWTSITIMVLCTFAAIGFGNLHLVLSLPDRAVSVLGWGGYLISFIGTLQVPNMIWAGVGPDRRTTDDELHAEYRNEAYAFTWRVMLNVFVLVYLAQVFNLVELSGEFVSYAVFVVLMLSYNGRLAWLEWRTDG